MTTIPGLQDIQGLDHIGAWPLAIGWWILIGFLVLIIVSATTIYFLKKVKHHRWQYKILKQLEQMETILNKENSQAIAVQLSTLIRRLAIHCYSREECAGLKGTEWLRWLSRNDPKKFDWLHVASSLIEAPYCSPETEFDSTSIKQSLNAAKGWVK